MVALHFNITFFYWLQSRQKKKKNETKPQTQALEWLPPEWYSYRFALQCLLILLHCKTSDNLPRSGTAFSGLCLLILINTKKYTTDLYVSQYYEDIFSVKVSLLSSNKPQDPFQVSDWTLQQDQSIYGTWRWINSLTLCCYKKVSLLFCLCSDSVQFLIPPSFFASSLKTLFPTCSLEKRIYKSYPLIGQNHISRVSDKELSHLFW